MVTVVLGLSPNCDGITDLSMQSGWGDGCDLGVCKAWSMKHQEREGNHVRGGRTCARREGLRSMNRDSMGCLALEGLIMRSALCELELIKDIFRVSAPAPAFGCRLAAARSIIGIIFNRRHQVDLPPLNQASDEVRLSG